MKLRFGQFLLLGHTIAQGLVIVAFQGIHGNPFNIGAFGCGVFGAFSLGAFFYSLTLEK